MSPTRTPRRSLGALLLLAAVLGGAALVQLGGLDTTVAHARPIAAAQTPVPGQDGRELFLRNCAWCHGQDGAGSQYGPSLVGVGAASADFQLSTGRMPLESERADPERGDPAFSPAEIDALVTYVGSLGDGPPVPQVRPGNATAGRDLYLLNCASCHSATGTGALMPGGRQAPDVYAASPTQVAEAVRVGPGLMPVFPQTAIGDEELDDIVTYVQQLGTGQNRGGADLGGVGPLTEGIVAFFVAVPLLLLVIRRLGRRAP